MIKTENYTNQQMYDEFLTYDSKNKNLTDLAKRHAAEARLFIFGTYDLNFYDRGLDTCVE